MQRWILVGLALVGCSNRTFEPLGPLEFSEEWFGDGMLECQSPDVCGFITGVCRDLDGPGPMQGCIDGRCLAGPALRNDYCARHGGLRSGNTNASPHVCGEGADRDACIECRAATGPRCVNELCATPAAALVDCLDAGFDDLPAGVERAGWRIVSAETGRRVACHAEGEAYERCVDSSCTDLLACAASYRSPSPYLR